MANLILLDPANDIVCPAVNDIVEYHPIDAWNHNTDTGAIMRVESIRDIVENPVSANVSRKVKRSRFLCVCVLPNGEKRAVYHIHLHIKGHHNAN